jgi:hypothetical protein
MYKCSNCNNVFDFPDIRPLDCGPVYAYGILGPVKNNTVNLCPECLSEKIERRNLHEKLCIEKGR